MTDAAVSRRQAKILQGLRGQRVAVCGLGRSNVPLVRFLVRWGCSVTGCDRKTRGELGPVASELDAMGVRLTLGPGYLDEVALPGRFDVMFVTPGMPRRLPELEAARRVGVKESSEVRLFLQLVEARTVGITGSDGKTTTTTLVARALAEAGLAAWVGGNIGTPLIEHALAIPRDAVVVLELSSFQLQSLDVSPDVGVVLNVTPNHLDYHASMEEYAEAKSRVFANQPRRTGGGGRSCWAVLNRDNPFTRAMRDLAPDLLLEFSRKERVEWGAFIDQADGLAYVTAPEEGLLEPAPSPSRGRAAGAGTPAFAFDPGEMRLRGAHNVENALAAACVLAALGVRQSALRKALRKFEGVGHRIELVAEIGGVEYYDDSIGTTPSRTIAGIRSFDRPIVLIAGGSAKGTPYLELGREIVRRVKGVVLLGQTGPLIAEAVAEAASAGAPAGQPLVDHASTMEDAVRKASGMARPGDVVLLSPASASFDMFTDYEDRARCFRDAVERLKQGP